MKKIEIAQAELALNLSNKPRILPLAPMDSNKKANNYTFKGFKIWMKKIHTTTIKVLNIYLTGTIILTLILNGLPYSVYFGNSKTFPHLYFKDNNQSY